MNKWSFNKKYLESIINKCNSMLLKKKSIHSDIERDISFFERWLIDDYSYPINDNNTSLDVDTSFPKLKEQLINSSKLIRKYLGYGFIKVLMQLHEKNIFDFNNSFSDSNFDLDFVSGMVLSTYEKSMPSHLPYAENIILAKKPHIHLMDKDILSYSYYSKTLDEAFILLNKNDVNGSVASLTQDAIESACPLGYTFDYIDLGSTLLRLLYHDNLYDKDNAKYTDDFRILIDDLKSKLDLIYPFLKFSNIISSKNYDVSDDEFLDYCSEYLGVGKDGLLGYCKKMNISDLFYYVDFLIDTLLAIEIRQNHNSNGVDCFRLLTSCCLDYYCENDKSINNKILIYKKYMEDINNRCSK